MKRFYTIIVFLSLFVSLNVFAAAAPPLASTATATTEFNTLRDVIIPLANMGIGAIIAILLIWQIFPILNRNTETLKEIAATLDVISNNNLRLAEKLLDIIEKQSLKGR